MTTATRTLVTATAAFIIAVATFMAGHTAHAQCASINVKNSTGCDLRLVMYDNSTPPVTVTYHIPPAGAVISTPPGFVAMGSVSNAGALIPAPGVPVGCAGCYACTTGNGLGVCCIKICGDMPNCTAELVSCPMGQCTP